MSEYYAVVRDGDSLQHHGVLGMRWGIRHDRRVRAAKAMYKTNRKAIKRDKSLSKDQKQRKIAASREQWMKERVASANRLYSKQDKATNERIARMSSRKTFAQASLLGSYGALKYNQSRANGSARLRSAARAASANRRNNKSLGNVARQEYYENYDARKVKKPWKKPKK